ncbi:phage tail protein [Salmonella enterica subsp. enterica serovar Kokomlemle]
MASLLLWGIGENVRLTDTVNLASGALQKNQNGADIPDKPLFVRTLGIVDSYPVGCPIPYPGPVAPDGYLLMDGRLFSTTLYPQLAKLYPNGELPDMRGMHVRGWDQGMGIDRGNSIESSANTPWHGTNEYGLQLIGGGGAGSMYPQFKNAKYSPRGYEYTFTVNYVNPDRNGGRSVDIQEKGRGLLTTQYFQSAIARATVHRVTSPTKYSPNYEFSFIPSPCYFSIIEQGIYPSGYNRIGIGLGISTDDPSGYTTDFSPESLLDNNIIPIGAPNVAFNYITKAA